MESVFVVKKHHYYKNLSAGAKSAADFNVHISREGGINLGTGFLTPYSFTTGKNQ
jgi:hypothetical protein